MNTTPPSFLEHPPVISPRSQRSREKQRARDTTLEPLPEAPTDTESTAGHSPPPQKQLRPPLPDASYLPYLQRSSRPPQEPLPPVPPLPTTRPLSLDKRSGHVPKERGEQLPSVHLTETGASFTIDFAKVAQQQAEAERQRRVAVQSPTDPSMWRLPPLRERPISAPLQPRLTDLRANIERDPQRTNPTFTVNVSFQFSMQPGELP